MRPDFYVVEEVERVDGRSVRSVVSLDIPVVSTGNDTRRFFRGSNHLDYGSGIPMLSRPLLTPTENGHS